MNQGTQGDSLTKKTEGQKSRDTVSLILHFFLQESCHPPGGRVGKCLLFTDSEDNIQHLIFAAPTQFLTVEVLKTNIFKVGRIPVSTGSLMSKTGKNKSSKEEEVQSYDKTITRTSLTNVLLPVCF
jgi:hypothetical protein